MKINFEEKFNELESIQNVLRKVENNCNIMILYGISKEAKKRLVFLSHVTPPKITSTKMISVNIYIDNQDMNWISFDLENDKYSNIFYTFCSDMIENLKGFDTEEEEIYYINSRFNNWKKMFQNLITQELSEEKEQGIFGELFFLNNYMIPKYGINEAILSWAGPDKYNKDFSIEKDWYEIKTSSISSHSIKITSLSQLDSKMPGYLVIIRVEKMSSEFNNDECSIYNLVNIILEKIEDINIQNYFLEKIIKYGVGPEHFLKSRKYDVKKILMYNVDEKFPRITEDDVKYNEIIEVTYTLNIESLSKYKVVSE